ncbi:endonuclease/exonuclease/phosphatase family protein [Euzebyella marina]|uniref:Endonuclease/exonuclease/phosphatase family protein n=1 Tax=Euzebyella marina TaxID=1761453 RepID=A0A3G2L358_9FLAO|nr:endonuclease/exonuclease/phosphatase family protein [Euzebyella marina]AYN66692.1 endonuclease/exonuclease/phosphatase family protein [Euzebyella marina]
MRRIIITLLLVAPMFVSGQSVNSIKAMTFNVRYANPKDGINIWENRRDWVAESINFFEVDVFGAQEVIESQLKDLVERLPDYTHVGIGRNGGSEGEFCPVFYRKEIFELLESDTFWLSETPEKTNSKGWDAALPRIVTWVKLRHKANGHEFYFFNTHFDHRGEKAQFESAKLLRKQIAKIAGDIPFLVTGDFNIPPSNGAYKELVDTNTGAIGINDTHEVAQKTYGPTYTFNGFALEPDQTRERIDYIFCSDKVEVKKHHTLDGQRGGDFISDHFPIMAIVSLR